MVAELNTFLRGWIGYFGFCQTPSVLRKLDAWIRHRLRAYIWRQWKHSQGRRAGLKARGVADDLIAFVAGSSRSGWYLSQNTALHVAFPKSYFSELGLISLEACCNA